MAKIFSVEDLVAVVKAAKAGGQYVTIYGESDIKLNKFPTDGSERVRIKDDFQPRKRFHVQFHFGQDYEKTMAKALGTSDYTASDCNRVHLVPNVIMQYVSTGTTCFIYIPENYESDGTFLNGEPISAEDYAYMERYKSKSKSNAVVEYRTLSVKNISRIAINKEVYDICIGEAASMVG